MAQVLDAFPEQDGIARAVSKVITQLMDGDVGSLVTQLQTVGGQSAASQERLLALLSTLAMDGAGADAIKHSGMVGAAVSSFNTMASQRAMEANARLISRLATNSSNIDEVLSRARENGGSHHALLALRAFMTVPRCESPALALTDHPQRCSAAE